MVKKSFYTLLFFQPSLLLCRKHLSGIGETVWWCFQSWEKQLFWEGDLYVWKCKIKSALEYFTMLSEERRQQCQKQAHLLTETKKMSFNLQPLFYSENKGSFQLKQSVQAKERVRETDREEEESEQGSEPCLGAISSLIVL